MSERGPDPAAASRGDLLVLLLLAVVAATLIAIALSIGGGLAGD
ncbi:hypothetical protein [Siculibacillus lacustris]|nr:hypothetical protein [Siculibacillus lacustris]